MRCNNKTNRVGGLDPLTYLQIVAVKGELRQRLLRTEALRDQPTKPDATTLVFRGIGSHSPRIESLEWMAEAHSPAKRNIDPSAYDVSWLVRLLLEELPIATSSAPAKDIQIWLQRKAAI